MHDLACIAATSFPITSHSIGVGRCFDGAPSELALRVCERACLENSIEPAAIDFVISCTQTPDYNNPGMVSCLLARWGKTGIPGLELKQFVSAPLYALDLAARLVNLARAQNVLVVCADLFRKYYPAKIPGETQAAAEKVLSDGAAALIVSKQLKRRLNFERIELLNGAQDKAEFCVPLPGSNQFPLRISAQQVSAGEHLPKLDIPALREAIASFSTGQIGAYLDRNALRAEDLGAIIAPRLYPQMHADLAAGAKFDARLCFDAFEQHGLSGAAALPLALSAYLAHNPQVAKPLLCVALSSSRSLALALVRKGDSHG